MQREASAWTDNNLATRVTAPSAPVSPALAGRLAEAIVRPLAAIAPGRRPTALADIDDRTAAAVTMLARHPSFEGPLSRAAARLSGLSDIVFDDCTLRRVGHSNASDCALFLATAAPALLEQAALHLGAIVLHRQLLRLALRREREALQRIVGEETYQIATREAPVLYAAFADLDDSDFVIEPAALGDEARERRMAHGIITVGQRSLHDFVILTEPSLAPLMDLRCGIADASDREVTAMTNKHLAHIAKLLHRRFGPWPPTIG